MPVYQLNNEIVFPPPHLAEEEGLLAVGGDLSIDRLLLAYSMGIFPWYDEGDPILWWSPAPRMIIRPEEFAPSKSLQRSLKKGLFHFSMDTAFEEVIHRCAKIPRTGQENTWITTDMIDAYIALHHAGYAHSVETWVGDKLVGGLYGLSLGSCFFGESMFSLQTDASKAAFSILARTLASWDFTLIDCQLHNPHLESLGAYTVPREVFTAQLNAGLHATTRMGPWTAMFQHTVAE
ncbi:MAG: leucyl/phenylalanyl-tRNA--protein transferase [Candidatus Hydrogenedentota bacterium]|nr:MAG: leucyl/phenylalanyl-tRNA--protein transferase [Candidatus Hydrogenedentota bacterium]